MPATSATLLVSRCCRLPLVMVTTFRAQREARRGWERLLRRLSEGMPPDGRHA